ncbi:hypothetical protein CASFOL_037337 [Castilleja foliolosa]|uniref:Uncharacterized protein n=1 Tax=Castilleja foliolosa TaxID=1961234 RepID=A0ABD3BNN4_9LAMI
MFATSTPTPGASETRDSVPAPSLEMVVYEPAPMPHAQIFPGQQGNPIDLDNLPTLIPTSVLARIVNRPMPKKVSRRLHGISPRVIPPAVPKSKAGPRRHVALERMNLIDEENDQSDSDDEDYLPSGSVKASSLIPDLTPEELESIAAAVSLPVPQEIHVVDDVSAPVTLVPSSTEFPVEEEIPAPAALSPPPAVFPEISAPSSPEIPHTDFFSEENVGSSTPKATAPITPTNLHAVVASESEDSDGWTDTLADVLTSLKKNVQASPKTSSKSMPAVDSVVYDVVS